MNCFFKSVVIILLYIFVPSIAFAGWQISQSPANISTTSPFQSSMSSDPFFRTTTYKPWHDHVVSYKNTRSWYSTKSENNTPLIISSRASQNGAAFPDRYYAAPRITHHNYVISVSGSLKRNIERIMHRYHWRVLWHAPYDFNFDGRIIGANLPDAIRKLLKPFPLQAQMYLSNRTIVIVPRETF